MRDHDRRAAAGGHARRPRSDAGRPQERRQQHRQRAHLRDGLHQHRYSRLRADQQANVRRLVPVWNVSLSSNFGEQGQPLVYNGVMFVTNAEYTVAIDVATGKQIWRTPVNFDPAMPRVVCCGVSNKGPAIYNGKVFRATIDAHVVALDHEDRQGSLEAEGRRMEGRLLHDGRAARRERRAHYRASPARSSACAPSSTAGIPRPARTCGAASPYPGPGEQGHDTWPAGEAYLRGGGSTWGTGSYDPRARARLLGHRQRRAVGHPRAPGRQPLHRVGARDPAEDGRDRLALPDGAERRLRPRRDMGMDHRRHSRERREEKGRHAHGARRLPLRRRPHQRQAPRGARRSRR